MGAITNIHQWSWSQIRARQRTVRRPSSGESIQMEALRHRYFPKTFLWRGHQFYVYAVERCWSVARPSLRGRIERHYFRVRCKEGTFDIYQDVRNNTWHFHQRVEEKEAGR